PIGRGLEVLDAERRGVPVDRSLDDVCHQRRTCAEDLEQTTPCNVVGLAASGFCLRRILVDDPPRRWRLHRTRTETRAAADERHRMSLVVRPMLAPNVR